ncbi:protein timeless-like protein [Leptotrombidium deliense]|uniref:Protein timeless-like protein n=1 Tax=Leptotrombidium deliense TaxID=299467 RepID=A0A443SNZ8_9ACAR|nr:protein timeless-like protein [Leptotrombidium deliense]
MEVSQSSANSCSSQDLNASLASNSEHRSKVLLNLVTLEKQLLEENVTTRNVRRSLGLSQTVQKHLIPILVTTSQGNNRAVIDVTLRLLVNLTLPIECLVVAKNEELQCRLTSIKRLKQLQIILLETKKSFLSSHKAIASIIKLMRSVFDSKESEKSAVADQNDTQISTEDCHIINNCLLLLRNLLHISESIEYLCPFNDKGCQTTDEQSTMNARSEEYANEREEWQSAYKQLLWTMLFEGLGNVLLLITEKRRHYNWTAASVQLITLLYKDQDFCNFHDLLKESITTSESSEDDVESDYTSSQQRLSSTSLNSDYSSKEYLNETTASKCDSGFQQPSDVSIISDSQVAANSSSSHSTENEARHCNRHSNIVSKDMSQSIDSKSSPSSVTDNASQSTENGNGNNQKNFLYNNSSGFSNGSSEEEPQKRSMHKVIKQHQRSTQVLPSDSSDESNGKKNSQKTATKSTRHHTQNRSRRNKTKASYARGVQKSKNIRCETLQELCKSGVNWEKKCHSTSRRPVTSLECCYPSDDDIRYLLKDFTLKFLHHSFTDLVIDLRVKLLHNSLPNFDLSHFLWLLSYFLKVAISVNINFRHIQQLFSVEVFGFLVFQGIEINEELELLIANKANNANAERSCIETSAMRSKVVVRKLHLLVTALRELITVLDNYSSKSTVTKEDKQTIANLRANLAEMQDFRQFFLLLIRNFTPMFHNKQFLVEVITANHLLLLSLQTSHQEGRMDLFSHLKQFATSKVMEQYGKVLEDFQTNSEFVNDCILTMMHHVSGDLKATDTLYHPIILKTYSLIMGSGIEVKDLWEDLIEYVMFKFVRTAQKSPSFCVRKMYGDTFDEINIQQSSVDASDTSSVSSYTSAFFSDFQTNSDQLYWLYLQFEQTSDPIGCIVDALTDEHNSEHSRCEILRKLFANGIINEEKYLSLKQYDCNNSNTNNKERKRETKNDVVVNNNQEIKEMVTELVKLGFRQQLNWIKELLLEACFVKILNCNTEDVQHVPEPVAYYNNYIGHSIPVVPYSEKQEMALYTNKFQHLLHKLGFHLPADVGKIYPRIPAFFTPDLLFSLALRLGPIDEKRLKFKTDDL